MLTRLTKIIILLVIASAITGCGQSESARSRSGNGIRFIVTGNTNPVSPFTGFPERLPAVIDEMNRENPVLVVHTGNIVHGGYDWMGVRESDLIRQYDNFKKATRALDPLLYTCAGEMDQYNSSPETYKRALGMELYYSFNYGSIHFIILHLPENTVLEKDDAQAEWLRRDLEENRDAAAIFVFSHHALFNYLTKKAQHGSADELHSLLSRYPVAAVFSGNGSRHAVINKNGITYHVAGCGGFNRVDWCYYYTQYYVVDYNGKDLRVRGKKMNFREN